MSTVEHLSVDEVLDAISTAVEPTTTGALAPINYDVNETLLAQLRAAYAGKVFDTSDDAVFKTAKEACSRMSKLRTATKESFTAWNAPVRKQQADNGVLRDHYIAEIQKIEDQVRTQVDAETEKRNAAANKKAADESLRIDQHVAALAGINAIAGSMVSASVAAIQDAMRDLTHFDYLTRRDWQEYVPAATDAIRTTIEALKLHLSNAEAREQLATIKAQQAAEALAREAEEANRQTLREQDEAATARIHKITNQPTACIEATAAKIQTVIDNVEKVDLATFPDARRADAKAAIDGVLVTLVTMHSSALAKEAAAAQAAKDQAELQAFRDQAARAAAEKETAAREAAAATARELAAAAQRAADEAARSERDAAAERQRVADAEQAERDRVAAAAQRATELAQEHAEKLLAMLIEARAYIADPSSYENDQNAIIERLDATIAAAQGE